MKVNWKKKIASTLLAAGILVPCAAQAVDIPLGDPGFEDYALPGGGGANGYAYSTQYRPTSAWIDDQDSPGSYTEDDGVCCNGNSNWMYDAAYADDETFNTTHRGVPTGGGDQAMHGRGHYNSQELTDVFEEGGIYRFSIWAQGDDDTFGDESRVWLYIFDGDVAFSQANSLQAEKFNKFDGDFVNRDPNWTPAESQAAWQQITTTYAVRPGDPEIGHPIGVGFWVGVDGAVDNASLSVTIPEPSSVILVGMSGLTLLGLRRRR